MGYVKLHDKQKVKSIKCQNKKFHLRLAGMEVLISKIRERIVHLLVFFIGVTIVIINTGHRLGGNV